MTSTPLFTDNENPYPDLVGWHTEMTIDTDEPMEDDVKNFLIDPNTLGLPEEYVEYLRTSALITGLDDFHMEDVDTSLVHVSLTHFVERLGPILVQQHLTHTAKFYTFLLFNESKSMEHVCVPDVTKQIDFSLFRGQHISRFKRHYNGNVTRMKDSLSIEAHTLATNQMRAQTARKNLKGTRLTPLTSSGTITTNPAFASPMITGSSRTAPLPTGTPTRNLFQTTPITLTARLLANNRLAAAAHTAAAAAAQPQPLRPLGRLQLPRC
jgi:hypothetical protein